jgi:transposase
MTSDRVEVITSIQRRRRWSAAEKEGLVAAALEPGGSVSAVARGASIHASQLYAWRRQLCSREEARPAFAAVRVAAEPAARTLPGAGLIEIEFATGTRMRVTGAVDATALTAAVAALSGGERRR